MGAIQRNWAKVAASPLKKKLSFSTPSNEREGGRRASYQRVLCCSPFHWMHMDCIRTLPSGTSGAQNMLIVAGNGPDVSPWETSPALMQPVAQIRVEIIQRVGDTGDLGRTMNSESQYETVTYPSSVSVARRL